jgi:hypothetical protein
MLTILEHLDAVHEDMVYSSGVLMGLIKCSVILDGFWIEYHDVSEVTHFQHAASLDFEMRGR